MKRIITLMTVMIFLMTLSASSAFAGPKQRHRWEGVAIGVGAAILGNALLNSAPYNCDRGDFYRERAYHHDRTRDFCRERVVVMDRDDYHDRACAPVFGGDDDRDRGHWEIKKIWMAPEHETVWNPGHFNEYNYWVPGQYIRMETKPGFWREERVWED